MDAIAMTVTTGLLLALLTVHTPAASAPAPLLTHESLFGVIATTGAEFSEEAKRLDGARVRFRAFAVQTPRPESGVYLTRTPEARLHPDDEDTLPWDAVAALFRRRAAPGRLAPSVTVTGTLRLGNRTVGSETVVAVIEDAVVEVPGVSRRHIGR